MSGRRTWLGGAAVAVVGLASGGWLLARGCAPQPETAAARSTPATRASDEALTRTAAALAPALPAASGASAPVNAPARSATADAGATPSAAPSPFPADNAARLEALRTERPDPRDLTLLADIERQLGREPPPELHALLDAHGRGAGRDELLRRVRSDLPMDLALRALVVRWLNAVAPDPTARRKEATNEPAASPPRRWVTPMKNKPRE